ncbi:MAG: putative metal transporter substrate-binding protein [Thermoleophilia bacterium]|nr:putative metal transporter substrate-binding protein [Thermoleophilia bacterium]
MIAVIMYDSSMVASAHLISRVLTSSALVVLALGVTACASGDSAATAEPEQVRIVTAAAPLTFVAKQLGGRQAKVVELTSSNPQGLATANQAHDLQLTNTAKRRLEEADVVLYLGSRVQPRLARWIDGLPNSVQVIDILAVDGIDVLDGAGGVPDPHVWMDPIRMQVVVAAIGVELDDAGIADAPRRADNLNEELRAADTRYRMLLQGCVTRTFADGASHDTWAYLGDRYDIGPTPNLIAPHSSMRTMEDTSANYLDELESNFDVLRRELRCTVKNPTEDAERGQ